MRSRDRLEALAAGDQEDSTGDIVGTRDQAERNVVTAQTRQRGVFNGMNKKLDVISEIPGYQLRIFNDTPGRIERAKLGGWELVTRNEVAHAASNKISDLDNDVGNKVRYIVGVTDQNEPLYAYLMKIKKEWYEEDQKDAADKIRQIEAEMVRNGGLNTDRIGEKYLPDGRKQAFSMRKDSFERGSGLS
jgi:hypothetical protein